MSSTVNDSLPSVSQMSMPGTHVLGFQGHITNRHGKVYETWARRMNVLNALGWLPVVGIISGIARLVFVHQEEKKAKSEEFSDLSTRSFLNANRVRGAFEVLSLGFIVFPILDIVVSIKREVAYVQALRNEKNENANVDEDFDQLDSKQNEDL